MLAGAGGSAPGGGQGAAQTLTGPVNPARNVFAHQFHDLEIIAEDSSLVEKKGYYHCLNPPRRPNPPRKWGLRG